MRVSLLLVPLAALAVAAASHTPSAYCDSNGQPALGIVEIRTGVPGGSQTPYGENPNGVFYVDDRNFVLGNGVWTYEEVNGIWSPDNDPGHNLQRWSPCSFHGCDMADRCVDYADLWPDQLLV